MQRFPAVMCGLLIAGCLSNTSARAQQYADVLGYYEPGNNISNVDLGFDDTLFDNALAALGAPGAIVQNSQSRDVQFVSLGGWTDDPATGENDGRPAGLVVGFSQGVVNQAGNDLLIVGNRPAFNFWEPGFVEVAMESDGPGATASGWADETFYLLKPSNYDALDADPRLGPTDIPYGPTGGGFSDYLSGTFTSDSHTGYVDMTEGGNAFDIDWAIDLAGDPVVLPRIDYVRIRTVSDADIDFGAFGVDWFSTEVDYVQSLPDTPASVPAPAVLPAALALLGFAARRRRAARRSP